MDLSYAGRPHCKFFVSRGYCRYGQNCRYLHVRKPPASTPSVSSYTPSQRKIHEEHLMNISADKTCGVCFEVVSMKKMNENSFGLLPNCNHCFCYLCITKWRTSSDFARDMTKRCPECRTSSNYVYKSKYWPESDESKKEFIKKHNNKLAKIHCKHFQKGQGTCFFGNECLFKHALANGKLIDVGPPESQIPGGYSTVDEVIFFEMYHDDDDDEDDDGSSFVYDIDDIYDFESSSVDDDYLNFLEYI